jgi:hypothetical protein
MKTGFRGTFVFPWTQTELDGIAGAPPSELAVGAIWRWRGEALRVDGPDGVRLLGVPEEVRDLHRHAARAARRLVASHRHDRIDAPSMEVEQPLLGTGFTVTDGRDVYPASLVPMPGGAPLTVFAGALPPADRDLWVTHVTRSEPRRTGDRPAVICFTPETLIDTPTGQRPIGDLEEGDRVLTRDDGPQPVTWIGRRRISGARLYAMPSLRPVRIRAGAMGPEVPGGDLLVSPDHRVLVTGARAQALFGTGEVLVAARDLVDDRHVRIDHRLREITYVHLMLDRHQVVTANGLPSESFHPAAMDLSALDPGQAAALGERTDPESFGPFARRMLTPAEAAILRHGGGRAH